ncbi:MAG: ABC transporter permease subunit, partial [Gammaproteobacteria bacterium]|nr:ABC transporter permease subunit [Gammaproteobacteria bacterium]NIT64906.1 ABC transporter permease subunit [Gammaproteobacteria bacterium]NIV21880.1 ABC transporter permease subunit [Gammaproteobacteria bacterium]NIY33486.1 ABC transporter permease subunit [Gammaproteobacteria bacterium]
IVLSAAGSAPSGELGIDRLSVTVASLTSLSVYLVPLIALLISFDAVAGEVERGTLALHLTYPISRGEILLGKLLAQLGVVALAVVLGYGVAAVAAVASSGTDALAGLPALIRLIWTSILLGAVFLSLGHMISSLAKRPSGAAGLAIGLWLVFIVLYDLGLLAAIVSDEGGTFTKAVFPWLLVLNPADAFRIFNLAASDAVGAATGLAGAASSIAAWKPLASILLWPVAAALLAR